MTVLLDPVMMRRALANLLRNAVEALAPRGGGRIEVRVVAQGGRAVLEVCDDGPGVAESERERIFEPYVTTKAGSGGSGLGLAIVKKVVLEHDGAVTCEPAPGGGACFRIVLPLQSTQRTAPRLSSSSTAR